MGWIRRETEKGTTQYICPNCHDYHEFREDFGEQTFNENFVFCRRCGARNGTGTAPHLTPPNEPPPCYTEEKRNTAYPLCAGRGFANCAHCALWSDFEEDQDETRINRPLTLEELREMDDEPVWCCPKNDSAKGSWMIVGPNGCENITSFAIYDDYGTGWLAYRRPPEVSP